MVGAAGAAVAGVDLRPLRGREDLVQVAVAAEGARPDVDEGNAEVMRPPHVAEGASAFAASAFQSQPELQTLAWAPAASATKRARALFIAVECWCLRAAIA